MDGAVLYNSSQDIGGFQFTVDGGATVTGGAGGDAAGAGFVVQGAGTTVLGFSFTGSSIAAGCGTLTELTLSGDATGLSGMVFSDPAGTAFDVSYYSGGGDDCASGIYDCAGVCDGASVEDCAGDCDGGAVVDECGVCNGDGIADGACDCCLLYTSPSPRDQRGSRMPSSA